MATNATSTTTTVASLASNTTATSNTTAPIVVLPAPDGVNNAAVIGGAVGGSLAALALVGGVVVLVWRARRRSEQEPPKSHYQPAPLASRVAQRNQYGAIDVAKNGYVDASALVAAAKSKDSGYADPSVLLSEGIQVADTGVSTDYGNL